MTIKPGSSGEPPSENWGVFESTKKVMQTAGRLVGATFQVGVLWPIRAIGDLAAFVDKTLYGLEGLENTSELASLAGKVITKSGEESAESTSPKMQEMQKKIDELTKQLELRNQAPPSGRHVGASDGPPMPMSGLPAQQWVGGPPPSPAGFVPPNVGASDGPPPPMSGLPAQQRVGGPPPPPPPAGFAPPNLLAGGGQGNADSAIMKKFNITKEQLEEKRTALQSIYEETSQLIVSSRKLISEVKKTNENSIDKVHKLEETRIKNVQSLSDYGEDKKLAEKKVEDLRVFIDDFNNGKSDTVLLFEIQQGRGEVKQVELSIKEVVDLKLIDGYNAEVERIETKQISCNNNK